MLRRVLTPVFSGNEVRSPLPHGLSVFATVKKFHLSVKMSTNPSYWCSQGESQKYAKYNVDVSHITTPWILDYFQQVNPNWNHQHAKIPFIVDVGCGAGKYSVSLSEYCDRLLGTDVSPTQIEVARRSSARPNIEYKVGTAEKLSEFCPKHGVDLITCSMSAHYFANDQFYAEVKRCLRERGVLAIIGHWHRGIEHEDPHFQEVFHKFSMENRLDQDIYSDCKWLSESYRSLYCPVENKTFRQATACQEMSREEIRQMFQVISVLFKEGSVDTMVDSLPQMNVFKMKRDVFGLFCHF